MSTIRIPIVTLIVGVSLASPTAHHAASPYFDGTRRVEVQGTISRFVFRNPHSTLFVVERSGGSRATEWQIEMGPAGQLTRMGWTPDILKPGLRVKVSGPPSRSSDARGICCATITRVDGSALVPGGRTAEGPLR